MPKKSLVRLTESEREMCREVIGKLPGTGPKGRRAHLLLKAAADGPAWTDARIAEAFSCRTKTVENVRQRFVERGFEQTLNRQKSPTAGARKLLDGREEVEVIALRRGSPPDGDGWLETSLSWRLWKRSVTRPSAKRLKNRMNKQHVEYWVIPPDGDAEFVAPMENVLET